MVRNIDISRADDRICTGYIYIECLPIESNEESAQPPPEEGRWGGCGEPHFQHISHTLKMRVRQVYHASSYPLTQRPMSLIKEFTLIHARRQVRLRRTHTLSR